MTIDRILHQKKSFPELEDGDIDTFLRERRFGSEHLQLEFKRDFLRAQDGKANYHQFCAYLVGYSNAQGGILIYGVEDRIKDPTVPYPDYLYGVGPNPTLEDLGEWARNFLWPPVNAEARSFVVSGKKLWVLRIPHGVNPPYCFRDPKTKSLLFTRRTAAGLATLTPEETRTLHYEAIVNQARQITEAMSGIVSTGTAAEERVKAHQEFILPKLEDPQNYGHVGIYCFPVQHVSIDVDSLGKLVEEHRLSFSKAIRYAPRTEYFQNGITVGYYPRAVRQDIKSTQRLTLYVDGVVAFDAHADVLMEGTKQVHPYWLAYELQRHLQLAKVILHPRGVLEARVIVTFANVSSFSLIYGTELGVGHYTSPYQGPHDPIIRKVTLADINDHNGPKRNSASPVVREIMDEVSRVFGLSRTPTGVWASDGYLTYVKGLENSR